VTQEDEAFKTLKTRVTTNPILVHPDQSKQFELEVDTSGFAHGAVLLQLGDDNKKHPVAYYSATLSSAERNYDIYDMELLAIVKALRHWRYLLTGTQHKVTIYSDHENLKYWRDPRKISRRVAREVLELEEYNYEIHHIAGKKNGRADALPRQPDYDTGNRDNDNILVLPDEVFVQALKTVIQPKENVLQDKKQIEVWTKSHNLQEISGIWYKEGRRVITGMLESKREVIKAHHDPPSHGHPGIKRTTQLVERLHWWPGM
jgi:ribonuclease HI